MSIDNTIEDVECKPPFIKLEQFLKFAAAVETGGMAKNFIAEGVVLVDGEVCTMRGKKLHGGEVVTFSDECALDGLSGKYRCVIKENEATE